MGNREASIASMLLVDHSKPKIPNVRKVIGTRDQHSSHKKHQPQGSEDHIDCVQAAITLSDIELHSTRATCLRFTTGPARHLTCDMVQNIAPKGFHSKKKAGASHFPCL